MLDWSSVHREEVESIHSSILNSTLKKSDEPIILSRFEIDHQDNSLVIVSAIHVEFLAYATMLLEISPITTESWYCLSVLLAVIRS